MIIETLAEERVDPTQKFFYESESLSSSNAYNMYRRAFLRFKHLCTVSTQEDLKQRVEVITWAQNKNFLEFIETFGAEVQELDLQRYEYNLKYGIKFTKTIVSMESDNA